MSVCSFCSKNKSCKSSNEIDGFEYCSDFKVKPEADRDTEAILIDQYERNIHAQNRQADALEQIALSSLRILDLARGLWRNHR